jgi:hypothetical protein
MPIRTVINAFSGIFTALGAVLIIIMVIGTHFNLHLVAGIVAGVGSMLLISVLRSAWHNQIGQTDIDGVVIGIMAICMLGITLDSAFEATALRDVVYAFVSGCLVTNRVTWLGDPPVL